MTAIKVLWGFILISSPLWIAIAVGKIMGDSRDE
jgi:hypothetical protein